MHTRLLSPGLVVLAGTSMYVGAAVAVGLFDVFPPSVVAWFRISAGALILLLIVRPRPSDFLGPSGRQAATYGVVTMLMNMAFYQSLAYIPLGTAVAIEFLGPIAIAAFGSRTWRDWASLALAAVGVLVISGATWSDNARGIMFALLAAVMWAAYIVAGSKIAGLGSNSGTSMAVGFTWAAVLGLPWALLTWPAETGMSAGVLLLVALALGFFSSVVPYGLDQVVLRMAGPTYFAVLQALLPLVATVVGAIVLAQWLRPPELIGVVCVVVAVSMKRSH